MAELRWILLAAGLALILGLWWWESRRARLDGEATGRWQRNRAEPSFDGADSVPPVSIDELSPSRKLPPSGRATQPRRPPLVEVAEDIEVDVHAYVGRDRRGTAEPDEAPDADRGTAAAEQDREAPEADSAAAPEETLQDTRDDPGADHRAPWVRTQPLEHSEITQKKEPEPEEPEAADRQAAAASQQRIVALRLVSVEDRWPGGSLRAALEAEGLSYGRYAIFHREREDGKSLFYVASMVEPGSFVLESMDSETFPGVSLFAIVPGPLEAPVLFDMMLATGRRLADRLKGKLQDEQGSTLTAQRILNLRDELVHLEHIHKRLRRT